MIKRAVISPCAEAYGKVARVLREILNVDEDEITPAATLQGDLGADFIDMLFLVHGLKEEFGIQIPCGELFPYSIFQCDPEFVQQGWLTDKAMEELRTHMPYADLADLDHDRRLSVFSDLFTVDLLAQYVAWKLWQDSAVEMY
jgi:acyl carrier protein